MPPRATKKQKSKKVKPKPTDSPDEFEFMLGAEVSPSASPAASTNINYSFLPGSPRDILRITNVPARDISSPSDTCHSPTENNNLRVIPEEAEFQNHDSVAVSDHQLESNTELSTSDLVVSRESTQAQKSSFSRRNSSPTKSTPGRSDKRRTIGNDRDIAVMREIVRLQNSSALLIPKLPFARLIRVIMQAYCGRQLYITPESLMCLQEASEIYAVQVMEDAYRCTLHRDRVTLTSKDMRLAILLRNDSVMSNI